MSLDRDTGRLLLGDRLAPITSEIGFVEAAVEAVVERFLEWQRPIQERRGIRLKERSIKGTLEEVLRALLPLTAVEPRRYLFVPTGSPWVAVFENSAQGADASSLMSVLSRLLRCRSLRLASVPDSQAEGRSTGGRFGASIFELYSPEAGNPRNLRRSLALVNDSGEWVFEAIGEPLPFEVEDRYRNTNLRDRFSVAQLIAYAEALGLRPFDEEFYRPAGAVLVEKEGTRAAGDREVSLEKARSRF